MTFDYRIRYGDFVLLFLARIICMFSYGLLAVVYVDNLLYKRLNRNNISLVDALIIILSILISLILLTQADRIGRLTTLKLVALLKLFAGLYYAQSSSINIITLIINLVISGILGVVSVSGGEFGPFKPIEQSALS